MQGNCGRLSGNIQEAVQRLGFWKLGLIDEMSNDPVSIVPHPNQHEKMSFQTIILKMMI